MLLIRTRECAGGATPTFKNVPSQILKTKCWESEVTSKEKDGSWQSQKKPLPVVTTEPCNIAFFWRWQCLPGGDATGLPGLLERERGATVETCNQSRIWSQCKPRLRRSPMPVYRSWMQHQEYQPQYARLRFLYLPVSLSSWSLDLPLDGSGVFGGESLWNPSMVTGATAGNIAQVCGACGCSLSVSRCFKLERTWMKQKPSKTPNKASENLYCICSTY